MGKSLPLLCAAFVLAASVQAYGEDVPQPAKKPVQQATLSARCSTPAGMHMKECAQATNNQAPSNGFVIPGHHS